MPKAPIQARRAFFDTLRDKSIRMLDWCAVDTELGVMVEPRQSIGGIPTPVPGSNTFVQVDLADASWTTLTQIDGGAFYSQYGTDGQLVPIEFNA